jgi:hypothetical protein
LNTRNKISAAILTAALLSAPLTPAVTSIAHARNAATYQDSDVPSDAEQAMFTRGQNLYNQGRYEQAASVLRDFLKSYPNSIITDLTLLWLGRSYMQLGRIQDAEQVGQRLRDIRDTPFSDIYEGELQAARREAASRPATTTATTSATPDNRSTTTQPSTTSTRPPPTASASPTPSPARPAQTNIAPTSTQNTNTANTGTTAQSGNSNKSGPQARLITTTTPPPTQKQPQQVASTRTTPTTTTTPRDNSARPNTRSRERRAAGRRQPPARTQANTNQTSQPRPRQIRRTERRAIKWPSTNRP